MSHTPKPWAFMNDAVLRKAAFQEAAPGITIASPANSEPICRVSGYLHPLEANARLITAAPDLLKACKDAIEEFQGPDRIFLELEQAIAKAEEAP